MAIRKEADNFVLKRMFLKKRYFVWKSLSNDSVAM